MQGLLIGIWFVHFSIYLLHLTLTNSPLGCHWEYYAVKTGVVFISIICYTIAAYKYKYRQCNELSDVNERVIITEYTERQLEQEYGRISNSRIYSNSYNAMSKSHLNVLLRQK